MSAEGLFDHNVLFTLNSNGMVSRRSVFLLIALLADNDQLKE
jgi:hypothetical protein